MKPSDSWKDSLLAPSATVREAVESINGSAQQICLVTDDRMNLLGTVTDGDIRRGLLGGVGIEESVTRIMNAAPLVAPLETSGENVLLLMNSHRLRQVPLIDENDRVVGLTSIHDLIEPPDISENWVVLMAGGRGARLKPLTDQVPKPLIPVGGKPLLESIMMSFIQQNFRKFYISVNYKAEAIKQHFGDGGKWNVEIRYLEEETRLGTAGALQLASQRSGLPLVIMNGDLLTRVNFHGLLDYHRASDSQATMCVREYDFQVPFGVVEIDNNRILSIDEKPVHRFFVNAGIYVLDPALIKLIPPAKYFDMTELFEKIISNGINTAVFPIHEYWLDIGHVEDLEQANFDVAENGMP